ncbi:CPSF A subunit region-domain-containing protein [Astrocystis sublimbata]|nr:CPSF A subunit region-domain-containing protein [Astrocystis sublimbata]
MATTSNMFLYSLTIKPPTGITQAIIGQFSGTKEQQILATCGSRLTLLRPDPNLGKISTILSQDTFSIVRSIASFRLAGSSKDYILVTSDSGRIAILEFLPARNVFSRIHLETFGKSGVRRVFPGQYLAVDPKGRACLLASIEKNKLLYILNRNAQAALTISSPLEAHRPGTLVFSLVALDVGYANPVFAALETDSDQDGRPDVELVYYELDLGLNHVVRKWAEPVAPTASVLFQVPGGNDGPSGVLVCGEESIAYRHSGQDACRVPIPRRRGVAEDPTRKRVVVAGAMHKLKGGKDAFFFLLQTDDGDLFKVTLDMRGDGVGNQTADVERVKVKYFDTVPVATSLCILKSGFLFVATEFGNHHFYQFEKLGDDDTETEFSSDDFPARFDAQCQPVYFSPRPLENLVLVESLDSMNPLLDSHVTNLTGEDNTTQIHAVCGNGARSRFRTLSHGLEATEIVASQLPDKPTAVWTIKRRSSEEYDTYIVIAMPGETLVMEIGEEVKQVADSGFLTSVTTLAVQRVGDDSLVQIHPRGIRHIHNGDVNEWEAPQYRSIVATATNERQVVIALSSGEVVYFEVDSDGDGSLAEYDERKQMSGAITCLSLGEVPQGRLRSPYLAVGCDDCTVQILSLDPDSTLERRSVQALTAAPSALGLMDMTDPTSGESTVYLHIGLQSGVYLRTVLDGITGELTAAQTKFLGLKPVKLFQVTIQKRTCLLALGSKSFVGYIDPERGFMLTPLSYEPLEWGWSFSSEQCEEGIVGISSDHLRIFSIENVRDALTQKSASLTYTPRQLVKYPDQPYFYTIESENNTLAPELITQLLDDADAASDTPNSILPAEQFNHPRARGRWASCISVIDAGGPQVLQKLNLTSNEAAVSAAIVSFASQADESFLVVGTGKDMEVTSSPRQCSAAYIHVYRFINNGRSLGFIHKTKVDEPALALAPFQGRLLAGIGKVLRIYDLGLKQLLRKAEGAVAPQLVVALRTKGSRVVVGDVQHGVTMVVYRHETNSLVPFVDDTVARWTTCADFVDYETVAGGDKFGNLWVLRCPENVSAEVDTGGGGAAREYLHGTPHRLHLAAHFFTRDIPTSIHKTNLGGQEVLLWSGLQGTLGALIPFVAREDVDFFQSLEMLLREEEALALTGRDHLLYRGYYAPVKGVVDGDLCERFVGLERVRKEVVAAELGRSVKEVERRVSVCGFSSKF